jgi:sentrin-specific protease 7
MTAAESGAATTTATTTTTTTTRPATRKSAAAAKKQAADEEENSDPHSPIILQFDSMALVKRQQIDAIKAYLGLEAKRKHPNLDLGPELKNLRSFGVPVPKQDNDCDCGVFLLEYAERLVKDPPDDVRKSTLQNKYKTWFEVKVVTQKREELKK